MVSRLCDDGVQGRDGRCVENSSCFQIFLFVPVCILLLGPPAGLISDNGIRPPLILANAQMARGLRTLQALACFLVWKDVPQKDRRHL